MFIKELLLIRKFSRGFKRFFIIVGKVGSESSVVVFVVWGYVVFLYLVGV